MYACIYKYCSYIYIYVVQILYFCLPLKLKEMEYLPSGEMPALYTVHIFCFVRTAH